MRTKKFMSIHAHQSAVALAAVAVTAMGLGGCAPAQVGGDTNTTVYRVGVIGSKTGFAAATGTDMERGWDLYWKQHDNKSGKFTVESYFEDDASDAKQALTKATLLATQQNVDVITGPVLANNALVVADYAAQQGIANLTQASADSITTSEYSPLVLRTGAYAGSQFTYVGGKWAYEQGHRTLATMCPDYAYGWDSCGGFVRGFVDAGGKLTQQVWYPANSTDVSSYVAQMRDAHTDVVFAGTTNGTDASNFIRAASDFGLFTSTEVIGSAGTTSAGILADVGDLALGMKSVSFYAEGSEPNAEFLKAYREEYDLLPTNNSVSGYATAGLLDQALSNASERLTGEELIKAVKASDTTLTPWGDISFDDYNNILGPVYIREVSKSPFDGMLWNSVVHQVEDADQFHGEDAEVVLKRPTYSQQYNGTHP